MVLLAKMVAYDPMKRFQSPTELVEAIQACRVDVARMTPADLARGRVATGPKTLFAVETREHLKDAFREKFKNRGYRVLVSSDPAQALKQYQQQPFHALIVDAGSVGKEGVDAFNRVLREADAAKLDLAAVLLLEKSQSDWAAKAASYAHAAVLVFPVTMRDLVEKIRTLADGQQKG